LKIISNRCRIRRKIGLNSYMIGSLGLRILRGALRIVMGLESLSLRKKRRESHDKNSRNLPVILGAVRLSFRGLLLVASNSIICRGGWRVYPRSPGPAHHDAQSGGVVGFGAALVAAKERGVILGSKKLHIARELAIASNQAAADVRAAKLMPIIEKAQKAGATSLRAIAQVLNDRGVPTPRGGTWAPMHVKNILDRVKANAES
jgi:hypothetical protein